MMSKNWPSERLALNKWAEQFMAGSTTFCSLRNTNSRWCFTIRDNWNTKSLPFKGVKATELVSASIIVPHTNHCPSPKLQCSYQKHYLYNIKIVKVNLDRKYPPRIVLNYGISGYSPLSLQPKILFCSQGYWLAELHSNLTNKQTKETSFQQVNIFDAKHFIKIHTEFCKCSFLTLPQYLRHFSTWEHLVQHFSLSHWKLFHGPWL